jgi:hypothetical protein
MTNPFKIFIIGAVTAIVISGSCALVNGINDMVGRGTLPTLEAKVRDLQTACLERQKQIQQDDNPYAKYIPINCGSEAGVQSELGQAQLALNAAKKGGPTIQMPYHIAFVTLVFSALPWTWYFLLRRVSELREAIVGK